MTELLRELQREGARRVLERRDIPLTEWSAGVPLSGLKCYQCHQCGKNLQSMSAFTKCGADIPTSVNAADFLITSQLPQGVERLRFVVRKRDTGRKGTAEVTLSPKD
jgi:hypothetical protein